MRNYRPLLFSLIILFLAPKLSHAFWIWTPETNKWVNPKYSVKETPALQLEYALDFYKEKEYKAAIQEFEKLLKHYERSKEAPEAQYNIGICYEQLGEPFKAFKNYQLVIDRYPFSERSSEIVKKQYDLGEALLEGQGKKNKFVEAVSGADYNVIDVFKAVIKNAPYGELAAPSQYKIGLYLMEKRLYQEARDEFEKLMNDYPNSEWAKAAKFQIAVTDAKRSTDAQYDQKVTQSAVGEFKEFLEVYPEAELSQHAKDQIRQLRDKEAENNFVVAQFYEKQKNFKAAKIYYQLIVDDYRESSWAKKSLAKIQELTEK